MLAEVLDKDVKFLPFCFLLAAELLNQSLNNFSKASGWVVNAKKSEIMFIYVSDVTSVDGILVKDVVKYLGFYICKSAVWKRLRLLM